MRKDTMGLRTRRTTRLVFHIAGTVALLLAIAALGPAAPAQDAAKPPKAKDAPKPANNKDVAAQKDEPKAAPVKLGLSINDPRALQGCTLISPFDSTKSFLIDMQGRV